MNSEHTHTHIQIQIDIQVLMASNLMFDLKSTKFYAVVFRYCDKICDLLLHENHSFWQQLIEIQKRRWK